MSLSKIQDKYHAK